MDHYVGLLWNFMVRLRSLRRLRLLYQRQWTSLELYRNHGNPNTDELATIANLPARSLLADSTTSPPYDNFYTIRNSFYSSAARKFHENPVFQMNKGHFYRHLIAILMTLSHVRSSKTTHISYPHTDCAPQEVNEWYVAIPETSDNTLSKKLRIVEYIFSEKKKWKIFFEIPSIELVRHQSITSSIKNCLLIILSKLI